MAEITREQLTAALDGFTLWVTPEDGQDARYTFAGKVVNAPSAARGLLDKIAGHAAPTCEEPCDWCEKRKAADAELSAMAAIVAAMEALDEETAVLGIDVQERVLAWACARWNYTP